MLQLRSVDEEARDCLLRCGKMRVGDLALHIHHETLIETLVEPILNRVNYILSDKCGDNVALRLRLLNPLMYSRTLLADPNWQRVNTDLTFVKAWDRSRKAWKEVHKSRDFVEKTSNQSDVIRARAKALLDKAYEDLNAAREACIPGDEARAKVYLPYYRSYFPDSPWNGKTIFAGDFAKYTPENNPLQGARK